MTAREWGIFIGEWCGQRGFPSYEEALRKAKDDWAPWEMDEQDIGIEEILPGQEV